MGLSIIVPVLNEEKILAVTVPAMLAATERLHADVIYVCNGCNDSSADVIRSCAGSRFTVIESANAGKAGAIRLGETHTTQFPRLFVDADICLDAATITELARQLGSADCECVSPRILFDLHGSSWSAAAVSKVWLASPHARVSGFHHVIGVSQDGRARWREFPDVIADDAFIVSRIPEHRRKVTRCASIVVRPPRSFYSWLRVRMRWRRGNYQLAEMGVRLVVTPWTGTAILNLVREVGFFEVVTYGLFRLTTSLLGRFFEHSRPVWFQDKSSR